ncbi:MAG: NADH-quinone oxidoreductase subunit NuoI [Nitrospirota bacterium]
MTVKNFIKKIFFIEILKGLALTLSRLFSHAVTIQYPDERRPIAPGFRGQHALAKHPQTGEAKCTGCGLCETVCPSKCIHVFREKGQVARYEIELLRCIYCAFCMEVCPYGAVVLTENYEYSDYSKDNLYMTREKLLRNWDKYMSGKKGEEYFARFWRPKSEDLETTPNQPVFRGRKR